MRASIGIVERTPDFGPPHPVVSDRINGAYYRPEADRVADRDHRPVRTAISIGRRNSRAPTPDDLATLAARYCRRFPTSGAGMRRGYTGVYDCSLICSSACAVPGAPAVYIAAGFSATASNSVPPSARCGRFITRVAARWSISTCSVQTASTRPAPSGPITHTPSQPVTPRQLEQHLPQPAEHDLLLAWLQHVRIDDQHSLVQSILRHANPWLAVSQSGMARSPVPASPRGPVAAAHSQHQLAPHSDSPLAMTPVAPATALDRPA